jgi:hypothetical protein
MQGATPGSGQQCAAAHSAAAKHIDDRQQDHRADKRDHQRAQAEIAIVDIRATDAKQAEQEPTQHCADNADDDVEQRALLRIRPHHDARQPAYQGAEQ